MERASADALASVLPQMTSLQTLCRSRCGSCCGVNAAAWRVADAVPHLLELQHLDVGSDEYCKDAAAAKATLLTLLK